jgi:RimJ/RimL family protein N-acetyltransferase
VTTLPGELVELRPIETVDAPLLRDMVRTSKVARWWNPPTDPAWPFEDDARSTRFAIHEDGELVGFAQFWEDESQDYRHAGIDLFLDPRAHGRGLGTDAVRALARHLFDARGHHRVVIDPAKANAAAIRCYEKVGFRPVGVMRRYERNSASGAWRDGMLMDLLPEDVTEGEPARHR